MESEARMTTIIVATVAVILVGAGWFAIRWQEETRRMGGLIATVLATPLANEDEICGCPCEYCSDCWRDDPRKGCQR